MNYFELRYTGFGGNAVPMRTEKGLNPAAP